MTEKRMAQPLVSLIEAKIRLFWSRLGAAVERSFGPRSRQSFDITSVLDAAEREIESHVKADGGRMLAPNRIDVKFDYETYSRLTDLQRSTLIRDLQNGLGEFIHNRRYATQSPLRVKVEFDPFVRRISVKARFDEVVLVESVSPAKPASAKNSIRISLATSGLARNFDVHASVETGKGPAGVGRSRDNALVIDHGSVSNIHASFTLRADGTVWLSDLGSSNGTAIDGVPLDADESRQVRSGARLRFGDVETLFGVATSDTPSKN